MALGTVTRTPWWAWLWPVLAWALLIAQFFLPQNGLVSILEAGLLIATVFAAVYHAEVVAHRIGEPFGSLVLALAVTIIEVALIVSVMISGKGDTSGLARDTIFSAVMIVCNGIVGLCLLGGGNPASRTRISAAGCECGIVGVDCIDHSHDGFPERYVNYGGTNLQLLATDFCRHCLDSPVWLVPLHTDNSAPRLFSSRRWRG